MTDNINSGRIPKAVEVDHSLLDVTIIDEKTGKIIGRPVLSIARDLHSGLVLEMALRRQDKKRNRRIDNYKKERS